MCIDVTELSSSEKLILMQIIDETRANDGKCEISGEKLSRQNGMTLGYVANIITSLKKKEYITSTRYGREFVNTRPTHKDSGYPRRKSMVKRRIMLTSKTRNIIDT